MARVCVALKMSPHDYRRLTFAEHNAIVETLNGAADG